ncbi:MAG: hypothetical protein ACFFDH_13850 [Promethearchaeota archaeon]
MVKKKKIERDYIVIDIYMEIARRNLATMKILRDLVKIKCEKILTKFQEHYVKALNNQKFLPN